MKKVIFVTGISSGIGFATADFFLQQGWVVVGTYRKDTDANYFTQKYADSFIGLRLDVTDFAQVDLVPQFLRQKNIQHIDALVNNAGIALAGPIEYQSFTEMQNIIQVNVLAVFKITQVIIPFLKGSRDGRIVNISSVSGKGGMPFLGIYCASKHAIEGFSESLRREMSLYGIKVSIVGPGSIKTPIWSKGFNVVARAYEHTEYKDSFNQFIRFASHEEQHALPVEDVVADIHHAVTSMDPSIRYAPIPRKWKNWYLSKLFPRKIYDRLLCKALHLNKKL